MEQGLRELSRATVRSGDLPQKQKVSQASVWRRGQSRGLRVAKSGLRGAELNLSEKQARPQKSKVWPSEEQSEDPVKARRAP